MDFFSGSTCPYQKFRRRMKNIYNIYKYESKNKNEWLVRTPKKDWIPEKAQEDNTWFIRYIYLDFTTKSLWISRSRQNVNVRPLPKMVFTGNRWSSKSTFHTVVCISKLSSIWYWSHTFNALLQNLELPFRKLYFYHHLLTLRLLPKIEMRNNTCKRSICLRNFDV